MDNKFYFDDEDERFEDVEGEISDEYSELIRQNNAINDYQLKLIQNDLNQDLLSRSVKVLQKSIFWWFYSKNTKLKMVRDTYKFLKILTKEKGR